MLASKKTLLIASLATAGVGIVSINALPEDSDASRVATSEIQAKSTTTSTTIVVPVPQPEPEPEPAPTHVVNAGETLVEISSATLATPDRWLEISVHNELANPHVITPGQVLTIPEEPVDVSGVEVPMPPWEIASASADPSRSRSRSTPASQTSSGRCGGDLPSCSVMECESGGSLTAHNPTSSASGKWQIIDPTWKGTEAGANSGVSSAADAPEHVQDAAAREIYAGGAGRSQWTC